MMTRSPQISQIATMMGVCAIAGAVVGSVLTSFVSSERRIESIRIADTEAQISMLVQAVDSYYVFRNEWPESLTQLSDPPQGMAPILERVGVDAWGLDFHYLPDDGTDPFIVWSSGPDRVSCSVDDVFMRGRDSLNDDELSRICPGGRRGFMDADALTSRAAGFIARRLSLSWVENPFCGSL